MKVSPLLACALVISAPAIAAPPSWTGGYIYEQSLGRDLSGTTALFVTHRLTLGPRSCLLLTEGYQTYERVRCQTAAVPGGIEVRFAGWHNKDGANGLRAPRYRPGEPLFRLTQTNGRIVTTWLDYGRKPDGPRSGRFFKRG